MSFRNQASDIARGVMASVVITLFFITLAAAVAIGLHLLSA